MKTLLAIDPGKSGGFATSSGLVFKMPDTEGDILQSLVEIHNSAAVEGQELVAIMEKVPIGMPGKGAAMAKLNANAAYIRGVLMALKVRLILIMPREWQQHFNVGSRSVCKSDSEWKNKLKAEAQRRFPQTKVTLDTADALLLLEYGKETNQ